MVKDSSLIELLDELKDELDSKEINPKLLYSWFWKKKYFDRNEVHLITSERIPLLQIITFCDLLKSKSDTVFIEIQKLACTQSWVEILNFLQTKLGELNHGNLVYTEPSDIDNGNSAELSKTNKVRKNLKEYLRDEVALVLKYWGGLGVPQQMDFVENFDNTEIVIKDSYEKTVQNINNFAMLFEQKFKRMVVHAPSGYGKSTFVHEIVRQWVNDYHWATKFSFVFLFRLGEYCSGMTAASGSSKVNRKSPAKLNLSNSIKKHLNKENQETYNLDNMYKDSLFVFDGFDEMQREVISDDLYDLIVGRSSYKPFVLITSRPGLCLNALKGVPIDLYIELKGFSKSGVLNHLKSKFGLHYSESDMTNALYELIKIPLFASMFGILHVKEKTIVTNRCELIDKYVKHYCERYRQGKAGFSEKQQHDLMLFLGQVAQAQFAFFRLYTKNDLFDCIEPISSIAMPSTSTDFLEIAKSTNLILPNTERGIFFPHHMFAEYFAAYFWCHKPEKRTVKLFQTGDYVSKLKRLDWDVVRFANHNYCCNSLSWFSAFLCYFNKEYKIKLWKSLEMCSSEVICVPLFEKYEAKLPTDTDLPIINVNASTVDFRALLRGSVPHAMKKFAFTGVPKLSGLSFETYSDLTFLKTFEEIRLYDCSVKVSGQEFLSSLYGIKSLFLERCRFEQDCNSNDNNMTIEHDKAKSNDSFDKRESTLAKLHVDFPRGQIARFLEDIIITAKHLIVLFIRDDDNGFEWITSLNYSQLKIPIEVEIGFTDVKEKIYNLEQAKYFISCLS